MADVIVFYVGGGCDGYCGKDYVIVKRYAHLHHDRFFMHFEERMLKAAMIEAKARGDAIVLIGHSWGGDAVIDLMLERETPRPDLIVTVDPVGRSTTYGLHGGNRFGGLWVNITAADDDRSKSGGNYVA